ncbi:unnamed protein product [Owenia fusiformis]|uniref:Adenosine 5'-monophosphoramidase HINT3 n=1 Tax=Owenia fusiformis TaxID=6347 RepID=A0A8J1UTQ0_OWEFU|nr:unnamed protein product [Owenia fusiformis]
MDKCIFCKIAQGKEEKTTLLYQDDELVVFKDHRPAASHHYLITSVEHIKDVRELTGKHVELVERLIAVGKQVLEEQGGNTADARIGFHWPPVTTIQHLHLHVIAPEAEMNWFWRLVFKLNSYWFVSGEYMIKRLTAMRENGEL